MALPGIGKHAFDSAFARQIRVGYPWLRFDEALEPGFQQAHRERTLPFVRVALAIVLGLVGLLIVAIAIRAYPGAVPVGELLPFAVFALVLLATIVVSHMPRLGVLYRALVTAVAASAAVGSVVLNLLTPEPSAQLAFAAIPVAIAFVYFALGLKLRTASSLALWATALYAFGAWFAGLPYDILLNNVTVLLIACVICGIGGYMLEHALRTGYLEGQLLAELVDRDGLTGLFNRGAFDRYFEQVWNIARRQGETLSLLLVDIDHFKRFNDRHGHQAGDDCLRRVARCASGIARRPLDFAGRYGGEEFIVVLNGADFEDAMRLAASMLEYVRKLRIPHDDSDVGPVVTVSIGLATVYPAETDRSPEGVIQLADRSLYRAKRDGRNRVYGERADDAFIRTGTFEVN